MASTAVNRLMDLAKMRLPGVLESVLYKEFFHLMNDFFKETNIWQERIEFDVTPSSSTYHEDPDAYTHFVVSEEQGAVFRLISVLDGDGNTVPAQMRIPNYITLSHLPNSAATYTAVVAVTVRDPTNKEDLPMFPEWVLTKYDNEILDGLLGRMMSQVAKPYSNAQLAAAHLRMWKQGVRKAKNENFRENLFGAQRWRFPQTFSFRR